MAKEEKTLDEMFQELDKLIQAMEEPEVSLEDSFQMYHQGIDMLKACNDKMDKIEFRCSDPLFLHGLHRELSNLTGDLCDLSSSLVHKVSSKYRFTFAPPASRYLRILFFPCSMELQYREARRTPSFISVLSHRHANFNTISLQIVVSSTKLDDSTTI